MKAFDFVLFMVLPMATTLAVAGLAAIIVAAPLSFLITVLK